MQTNTELTATQIYENGMAHGKALVEAELLRALDSFQVRHILGVKNIKALRILIKEKCK